MRKPRSLVCITCACVIRVLHTGGLAAVASIGCAVQAAPVGEASTPVDETEALDRVRFVVGAVVSNAPVYYGQTERQTVLKPMVALRWGHVRFSNPGAGGLIGESSASGASTELVDSKAWRVTASLLIDLGRRIENDSSNRLEDLPRVRSTLRGRLALRHTLSDRLAANASLSTDLLGRQGGSVVSLGLSQQLETPEWLQGLGGKWSAGAALTAADATHMRNQFGVPTGARRFAPYEPGAGWQNASLSLGWRRAYGAKEQWVLFGGTGVQRLLGPAANAPFIQQRSAWTADVGLAYRR